MSRRNLLSRFLFMPFDRGWLAVCRIPVHQHRWLLDVAAARYGRVYGAGPQALSFGHEKVRQPGSSVEVSSVASAYLKQWWLEIGGCWKNGRWSKIRYMAIYCSSCEDCETSNLKNPLAFQIGRCWTSTFFPLSDYFELQPAYWSRLKASTFTRKAWNLAPTEISAGKLVKALLASRITLNKMPTPWQSGRWITSKLMVAMRSWRSFFFFPISILNCDQWTEKLKGNGR